MQVNHDLYSKILGLHMTTVRAARCWNPGTSSERTASACSGERDQSRPCLIERRHVQVNHDYESVKMLDLGMSADDTGDGSGSDSSEGGPEGPEDGRGEGELAGEVAELKSELAEAKQQIGRILQIQEALARQALSKNACKALFEQKK